MREPHHDRIKKILQLKNTLSAVRERFDQKKVKAEEKAQAVEAKSENEIKSLRETAANLGQNLKTAKMNRNKSAGSTYELLLK